MRPLRSGLLLLIVLVSLAWAAPSVPSQSNVQTHGKRDKIIAAKNLTPLSDSVKKHTKENTGTLLGRRMQEVQKHLGQDKGGKLPIQHFDKLSGTVGGHGKSDNVLMKTSIESNGMKTGNMEKSVNMHSLRPEGRIPAGLHEHGNMMHRVDPLPSSHLNKLTSHDKHHHSYHHHPYHNLQPDMTPKEHLHSLNLRRGKHADGNPSDHYQMYQLAHGNSRTFGKHPSDMEGHRTHAGQWSDLDRFHGQKGSSKWGRSEPHLHHARRDLPEYGISARRMYDDAYDYRKPEWMGQSKPEIVRDRYEANQSPVRHNQNFLSHMGGQPSFSERDWSRRRPDQPSFGAFGQKFF